MGGIGDSEPALKRVKASSAKLDSHLRTVSSCSVETVVTGLPGLPGTSMTQSPPFLKDGETVGSKGIIRRSEFVKILISAMYSLGYGRSGACLEEESGILLHSNSVQLLREQVKNLDWDASLATLHQISELDEISLKLASFLILEQKFLECLKIGNVKAALNTLRKSIAPLHLNTDRVQELASYLISSSQFEAVSLSDKDTMSRISGSVLEKLEKLLPASVMVPENRLQHLVEQALDVQRDACVYHNTLDDELSLYRDHQCGSSQIPSQTLQVLQKHTDEVWFIQFSHNGKFLASASKDCTIVIWEVNGYGRLSLKHELKGHQRPVLSISWSHDDNQLLTCGKEGIVRRWDVSSGECLRVYGKEGIGLISCGWLPDGKRVFSGMTDKSICMWDLDGEERESWEGQRTVKISDMAITDDGKHIICICSETVILLLEKETNFERLLEEKAVISSFTLSKDNKFLLVNLINQEIHLWSIEGDLKLVSKYTGHKRNRFLIRSCFGGLDETFIASGSEDSQVYIWHKNTSELLLRLPGHSGAVNCVSWNPANPGMLASASDDRTIRIWGVHCGNAKHNHNNGNDHRSNGTL